MMKGTGLVKSSKIERKSGNGMKAPGISDGQGETKGRSSTIGNRVMRLYSSEHRTRLYGEQMFVVSREEMKRYDAHDYAVWRIHRDRNLLQQFLPAIIDGRNCHYMTKVCREIPPDPVFIITYQPVLFHLFLEKGEAAIGMVYHVAGSTPLLGHFSGAETFHADFMKYLHHIVLLAVTDKMRFKGASSIQPQMTTAVEFVDGMVADVTNALCWKLIFPDSLLFVVKKLPKFRIMGSKTDERAPLCEGGTVNHGDCPRVPARTVTLEGNPYEEEDSFRAIRKLSRRYQTTWQLCGTCAEHLKAFHSLLHHKFWLFVAYRLQMEQVYSSLQSGQCYNASDVISYLLEDPFHNRLLFYEFFTLLFTARKAMENLAVGEVPAQALNRKIGKLDGETIEKGNVLKPRNSRESKVAVGEEAKSGIKTRVNDEACLEVGATVSLHLSGRGRHNRRADQVDFKTSKKGHVNKQQGLLVDVKERGRKSAVSQGEWELYQLGIQIGGNGLHCHSDGILGESVHGSLSSQEMTCAPNQLLENCTVSGKMKTLSIDDSRKKSSITESPSDYPPLCLSGISEGLDQEDASRVRWNASKFSGTSGDASALVRRRSKRPHKKKQLYSPEPPSTKSKFQPTRAKSLEKGAEKESVSENTTVPPTFLAPISESKLCGPSPASSHTRGMEHSWIFPTEGPRKPGPTSCLNKHDESPSSGNGRSLDVNKYHSVRTSQNVGAGYDQVIGCPDGEVTLVENLIVKIPLDRVNRVPGTKY